MSLTTILLAALLLSLLVGAFFNPMAGIFFYLSIYLLYNPTVWYGRPLAVYVQRPSLIAVIVLSIGCLLNIRKLDWNISRKEIEFYLFLGAAWLVSLAFGVGMHEQSWAVLEKITKMFVAIFILLRVVNTFERYNLLVWAYILAALFLAFQAHVSGQFFAGRLENMGGPDFREANSFASFLAVGISLLSFRFLNAPPWRKVLYVIGIAGMLNAIIFTKSRAVFMGMALACPFVLLQVPRIYRKRIFLYLILGAILLFTLADKYFLDRMATIKSHTREALNTELHVEREKPNRIDFWKASLLMFKDHPLGIGVANFADTVPFYDPRNPGMDAHNTYVLCYSETGILGISLFVIIILETFLQLKRIRNLAQHTPEEPEITLNVLSISTSLLIYLLGGMMTHSYLYLEIVWMLFALPICLENATRKLVAIPGIASNGITDAGIE
jgi:O-antigen ligase